MKEPFVLGSRSHFLICAFAILLAPELVVADDVDAATATHLQRSGHILPLSEILMILRPVTGDRILEVETDHGPSGFLYEIYFVDPEGRRHEIYVDGRNGEIVMQKAPE